MAVLPIRLIGDPVLRHKARPVEKVTRRHRKLIEDMEETMYRAPGVGLAANQVGVLERIIVADPGEGPAVALINPRILSAQGSEVDVEGCLSIPGVTGYVERAQRVKVAGLDERGRSVVIEAEGFLARILQHEIDHLDGVLFIDRASRIVREQAEGSGEAAAQAADGDGAAAETAGRAAASRPGRA